MQGIESIVSILAEKTLSFMQEELDRQGFICNEDTPCLATIEKTVDLLKSALQNTLNAKKHMH